MIKKFSFLFLSFFLVSTSIIEAQNRLVLTKESEINLLKRFNLIEITGTVVSPTFEKYRLRNAVLNVYADSLFLFSDSTDYRGNYNLLFSLKNICADSIYIKAFDNEFSEFISTAVPFENNTFGFSNRLVARERGIGCVISKPLVHRYIDDNHFSSGRVFKREDFQYIPKKE